MTTIPLLSLDEAEGDFAAKAEAFDVAITRYDRWPTDANKDRMDLAAEAFISARASRDAVQSQQPQHGRGFYEELEIR